MQCGCSIFETILPLDENMVVNEHVYDHDLMNPQVKLHTCEMKIYNDIDVFYPSINIYSEYKTCMHRKYQGMVKLIPIQRLYERDACNSHFYNKDEYNFQATDYLNKYNQYLPKHRDKQIGFQHFSSSIRSFSSTFLFSLCQMRSLFYLCFFVLPALCNLPLVLVWYVVFHFVFQQTFCGM